MRQTDVAIVGAGPAGLSAAIEAARAGASVVVIDENRHAGGQLVKQTHKFFGSSEGMAGVRGIDMGKRLVGEALALGAEIWLGAAVYGIDPGMILACATESGTCRVRSRTIIMACGATENALPFPGWTLPGVMGAGAAQTMVNLHRVLPGKRILMVGSGNVGLVVAYQLLQAGAEVAAVLEALPEVGGYEVHAAKLKRRGVPILLSRTVLRAAGADQVEAVVTVSVDDAGRTVPGSESTIEVDVICLAVGLSPMVELPLMAGCRHAYVAELGGLVPVHGASMQTTVPGVYVAGDVSGVEEASTAIEEGRLAGVGAASLTGFLGSSQAKSRSREIQQRLGALRMGPFGERRLLAKRCLDEMR